MLTGFSPVNGGLPATISYMHDAERVQVAARVRLRTLGLLGREVGGGAHHGADLREVRLRRCVERTGDAEVGHLHLAVRADQDVRRLDVAVRDVVVVGEPERGRDLAGDLRGLLRRELLVRRQDLGEGAALHVLHDDEVGAFVLAPVVDVDDVRVGQVGGRLCLAAEPLDEVGVGGELGEQHLDGDLAVEQQVARREHVGHAAAPDPLVDLVPVVDDRRLTVVRHCVLSPPPRRYAALCKVTDWSPCVSFSPFRCGGRWCASPVLIRRPPGRERPAGRPVR